MLANQYAGAQQLKRAKYRSLSCYPMSFHSRDSKTEEMTHMSSIHSHGESGGQSLQSEEISKLRQDVASLKDTIARIASQASSDAVKTVRNLAKSAASQVGSAASGVADTGSELASSAKQHAKTFASELEAMARRNPLGTIAGALLVGVVIGFISRGGDR
jgi:ElaB/YqjD/DUF883 family membrane-anchored ribosome-binding protein